MSGVRTSFMRAPFCSLVFFATFVKDTVVPRDEVSRSPTTRYKTTNVPSLDLLDFGMFVI